jgi:glycosyltransferase involved in cell wall biosynthesis
MGQSGARRLLKRIGPPGLRRRVGELARRLRRPISDDGAHTLGPLLAQLVDLAEARAADIVWLGFGGISYQLAVLKELTGRPLVIETESVWSRFILRELPYIADRAKRAAVLAAGRAKEAEERWGVAYADLTTAVSPVDADYFRAFAADPRKVMVLANVVDVDSYADASNRPATGVARPSVCFPGSFSRGTANVDAALWLLDEVMPLVWRTRPEVRLYLVGRDPTHELLRRAGPRVHITGGVPSVTPYLRQASAVVVPLRWESGTRFKILEAFACETPVVSTALGAEGLAVEHGRHLLLADTAEEFADGIRRLCAEPELGAQLALEAGRLVRQEYDLSSAERQIKAILDQLGFSATRLRPGMVARTPAR